MILVCWISLSEFVKKKQVFTLIEIKEKIGIFNELWGRNFLHYSELWYFDIFEAIQISALAVSKKFNKKKKNSVPKRRRSLVFFNEIIQSIGRWHINIPHVAWAQEWGIADCHRRANANVYVKEYKGKNSFISADNDYRSVVMRR